VATYGITSGTVQEAADIAKGYFNKLGGQ